MAWKDFRVKLKRLLGQKENYLLRYNVTGDCLTIKLEGNLKFSPQ